MVKANVKKRDTKTKAKKTTSTDVDDLCIGIKNKTIG